MSEIKLSFNYYILFIYCQSIDKISTYVANITDKEKHEN